jgi:hypothetical protein
MVGVSDTAGVNVSVGEGVNVGFETVAVADSVRDARVVGCTGWVNAVNVEATLVATLSEGVLVGLPFPGIVQAPTRETNRIEANIFKGCFIGGNLL